MGLGFVYVLGRARLGMALVGFVRKGRKGKEKSGVLIFLCLCVLCFGVEPHGTKERKS